VAVVLDADGLSDDHMQLFARWTNLSETTSVLPPTVRGPTRPSTRAFYVQARGALRKELDIT
jgi:predicted PhzF superfamily epimerase YddE/YHI9